MSHEIIYDRRFIRMPDNKIIPVTLCGSSNCTMFVGCKEILERRWTPYLFGNNIIVDADDYMSYVNDMCNKYDANYEAFVYRSKWVTYSDVPAFVKNGIKNAYTIEEYANNGYPIYCSISFYDSENGWFIENKETIRTTDDFMKWYEIAQNTEKNGFSKWYNIDFKTIKPVSVQKKFTQNSPIIVKCGRNYVCSISIHGTSWCTDPTKAIVFDSEEDFNNRLKDNGQFDLKNHYHFKIYSAKALKKATAEKPYCVKIVGGRYEGLYVRRISKSSLFPVYDSHSAIRFTTEEQANKYVHKLKTEHSFESIDDYVVVKE